MTKNIFATAILFLVISYQARAQKTVKFPSLDSVTITADLYKIDETSPIIVLCHLSDHSRGEYIQTAKRLNGLGYNCLAIDTRTGNEIFEIKNETHLDAISKGKTTDYLDSEQDIIAAINYADKINNDKGVTLLGSSFSASLALKIAVNNSKVNTVLAFSPGEYFGEKLNLKKTIGKLNKPVFLTSSKEEANLVTTLASKIKSVKKVQFIPTKAGAHGSISLWKYNENSEEYWIALIDFLKSNV